MKKRVWDDLKNLFLSAETNKIGSVRFFIPKIQLTIEFSHIPVCKHLYLQEFWDCLQRSLSYHKVVWAFHCSFLIYYYFIMLTLTRIGNLLLTYFLAILISYIFIKFICFLIINRFILFSCFNGWFQISNYHA